MIIQLEKKEIAALTLHMSIMRKNVRKGFKSNYGRDSKDYIASYDEVKNTIAKELENMGENEDSCYFHFNIREIDMLFSFLDFYVNEVDLVINLEKLSQEDKEQMKYLSSIKDKVIECKAA